MSTVESTFESFAEAAAFAKAAAAKSGVDTKMSRTGNSWLVLSSSAEASLDDGDFLGGYDRPTPIVRQRYMSDEEIIETRDTYRSLIASKGLCYQCQGSCCGERGHLCSVCKGKGYL